MALVHQSLALKSVSALLFRGREEMVFYASPPSSLILRSASNLKMISRGGRIISSVKAPAAPWAAFRFFSEKKNLKKALETSVQSGRQKPRDLFVLLSAWSDGSRRLGPPPPPSPPGCLHACPCSCVFAKSLPLPEQGFFSPSGNGVHKREW